MDYTIQGIKNINSERMTVTMEINYKIIFPDTFKIIFFWAFSWIFSDPGSDSWSHGMGFACIHAPEMVSATSCQGIDSLVRFSPDRSAPSQLVPAPRILLYLGVKL